MTGYFKRAIVTLAVLLALCVWLGAIEATAAAQDVEPGSPASAATENIAPALVKKVFTPKYSPISLVSAELNKLKSNRGKMVAIGNDIYVEDDAESITVMNQVFMRLDRPAGQILIEVRIVEASAAFAEKYGFQRLDGHSMAVSIPIADLATQVTPVEEAGPPDFMESAKLKVVVLNKDDIKLLNAAVIASEHNDEARITSSPRIMAVNDLEVSIRPGHAHHCCFFCSSSTSAANVSFIEEYVEMKLKPHIEETGDVVILDISLFSETIQSGDETDQAAGTFKATATIMLKENEAALVSGILVGGKTSGGSNESGLSRLPLPRWPSPCDNNPSNQPERLMLITAAITQVNI